MAALDFNELYKKYDSFHDPCGKVYLGGDQDPTADKKLTITIDNLDVSLTSDFKASIATFDMAGLYNSIAGEFLVAKVKKYLLLGMPVKIGLGYSENYTEVFR